MWYNEILVVDDEPFRDDVDSDGIDAYKWQMSAGAGANSLEGYIDAVGESWDATSHNGLGYTVDYNKISR